MTRSMSAARLASVSTLSSPKPSRGPRLAPLGDGVAHIDGKPLTLGIDGQE